MNPYPEQSVEKGQKTPKHQISIVAQAASSSAGTIAI
jgi:hypothetical protein